MSFGAITHITKIWLSINNHHEMSSAFVTTLGGYHLTLGIPWLKHHDVKIDFASNSLTFESEYFLTNCVNDVTMAYRIAEELPHFLRAYARQSALGHKVLDNVTTLQIGSYSGLDSSPYGIPSGNHIEDRPVYVVYYR